MNKILLTILGLAFTSASLAGELAFNVLTQDKSIVSSVRSEGSDVWIKLTPNHVDDTVTVRISNKNRDFYRNWFNDSVDLVSTGFRGNDVWSDRVQTNSNFIEYWVDGVLVLHLERK